MTCRWFCLGSGKWTYEDEAHVVQAHVVANLRIGKPIEYMGYLAASPLAVITGFNRDLVCKYMSDLVDQVEPPLPARLRFEREEVV